ncbi:radical SAM protein [Desulfobacterales bacterium HSG2]|nr:radical SAM protein [Desulfobacterales bacterium HSG2]
MKDFFLKTCTRRNFLENSAKLCFKAGLSSIFFDCHKTEAFGNTATAVAKKTGHTGAGFEPGYLKLHKTGELKKRAEKLRAIMESCRLCPRRCGVNRLKGMRGFCGAPGDTLVVSASHPHFGEERPLVGNGGSGTIFLAHCNLRCVFCQNWEISQLGRGSERNTDELAGMMLRLQEIGCHNLNFVTPTHYSAPILKSLDKAAKTGLRLPVVYNTSGWERPDILRVLDGIVDIYLPDFKYWDSGMSAKYSSGAESYPEMTREAILEMHRQVGVAKPAKDGIMQRGLMIRHLVMPNNTGGSEKIMEWIAENLPKDTYVNIMAQYNPVYKAYDYPDISRRITREEYKKVVNRAKETGLTNLDIQGYWWM